jgi:hypothetical protein
MTGAIVRVEKREMMAGADPLKKVTLKMSDGKPGVLYIRPEDPEWKVWKNVLQVGNVLDGVQRKEEGIEISRTSIPVLIDRSNRPEDFGSRVDLNQRELL